MNDQLWQVISVSLEVAICATFFVIISSIFLAAIIVNNRSKIVRAIEFLIYLPMTLPPVALGYGLLLIFGQNAVVGRFLKEYFGVEVAFTFVGAVVASFCVSLGIGVRTIRVAIERIDAQQIQIAQLLGANRFQVFIYIVLPQCRSAIIAGAILVFIRAISEFGATMVLAGNSLGETRTLALAIWIGMETPGLERECLLLVLIAVFISLIAIVVAELLLQRHSS